MSQILYYFFSFFINIDFFICLFLVLSYFLWRITKSRGARKIVSLSVFLLFFIGILPTSSWMVAYLENYYPKIDALPDDVHGIIILGGSFDRPLTVARGQDAFNFAAGRFFQGLLLSSAHPHLPLVFTGGGKSVSGAVSEADFAQKYIKAFGFDLKRVLFESNSRDTVENAFFTHKLVQPKHNQKWVLVTTALHMPRSVGIFRAQGWNIIPYPVDYHTDGTFPLVKTPNLKTSFLLWGAAVKEWAGLIANRLYKQTPTLLPERI